MASVRPVELAPDAATAQRSRAERSKLRRELGAAFPNQGGP